MNYLSGSAVGILGFPVCAIDGMRWRLTGDMTTEHLIGTAVTVEGTISGVGITAYYLAPRMKTPTC